MPSPTPPPSVISLSAMASLCRLSRSRFYELVAEGIMPPPVYDLHTKRPLYPKELQELCLQVRSSNIGINGRYILFYGDTQLSVSATCTPSRRVSRRVSPATESFAALKEGLQSLGLSNLTDQKIKDAVKAAYPNGTTGIDEGEVLRSVFRSLRRQQTVRTVSET